jgi:hypothetical protein
VRVFAGSSASDARPLFAIEQRPAGGNGGGARGIGGADDPLVTVDTEVPIFIHAAATTSPECSGWDPNPGASIRAKRGARFFERKKPLFPWAARRSQRQQQRPALSDAIAHPLVRSLLILVRDAVKLFLDDWIAAGLRRLADFLCAITEILSRQSLRSAPTRASLTSSLVEPQMAWAVARCTGGDPERCMLHGGQGAENERSIADRKVCVTPSCVN